MDAHSHIAWAENIANVWLPIQTYGKTSKCLIQRCESTIPTIKLLVLIHSACPYTNHVLKCSQTLHELDYSYLVCYFEFFRTSAALSIIQKQLTPVFLVILSQYCLKYLVTSLRLHVSSWDNGLVVHALEAATSYWVFVHFGSQ